MTRQVILRRLVAALAIASSPLSRSMAQSAPLSDSARTALVERAMSRMRAGPEHAVLAELAGEWIQVSRYANGPGKPDVVLSGPATVRSSVQGRFWVVESEVAGATMTVHSMTILGFDRRFGKYTLVGHDSFGTYYVTAAGPRDSTGAIRLAGTDRMVDGAVKVYEFVLIPESPNQFALDTFFLQHDGSRHRAVHTTFTRVGTSR